MDNEAAAASVHSILEPFGVHAQLIEVVWDAMLWICGLMYVIVLAFLVLALVRKHRAGVEEAETRRLSRSLAIWTALIVVGLFSLTLASFLTDRALVRAAPEPQLSVRITGHQWWWEVEYTHADPSQRVRTANELHLPVNAQVHVELSAADVIHSFWAPSLNGKRDLIPGRTNELRLQPTAAGVYRAQCAEFCGYQHANMALDVVVESEAEFQRWRERQLASAAQPRDASAEAGLHVFMASACNLCHAIAGTSAFGQTGPDLTHIASRRSLAAGALANTPENLRRWLANPQRVKPGNHMPVVTLDDEQLDALTAYLSGLQ
jgi:cytochrome c oxidase subunit II